MGSIKKLPEIRRMRAADARCYRALLVEALIVHPDCFVEDYNAEIKRPLPQIEDELERGTTIGVWFGDVLGGIASSVRCDSFKRHHCGTVRNLYVREKFRHKGVASLLLKELLRFARSEVKKLEVQVPFNCENVVRLFELFGFRLCGLLPGDRQVGAEELDVWMMTRSLR